jgi:plastocyanin
MVSRLSYSSSIDIVISDNQQSPMSNVVIYLLGKGSPGTPSDSMAIMDQINTQFYPHILAVQRNTQVSFPNSDSIQHHVYSFSPAKVFELELYKGLQANPLLFDKLGIVEMGCNVHDWMLGYIYVVDTPYFAKTDQSGSVNVQVPDGEYTVRAWHPRISDSPESFQKTLVIQGNSRITMQVPSDLLPDVNAYEHSGDEFGEYE